MITKNGLLWNQAQGGLKRTTPINAAIKTATCRAFFDLARDIY
jgi:hypothetical protein